MHFLPTLYLLVLFPLLGLAEDSAMTIAEALGQIPNHHRKFRVTRPQRDGPIATMGTADENGFRVSPSSGLPGKRKHLFVIGGTSVFGRGLRDDETVTHYINERSLDYEAYPLAYFGFGLEQARIRFKEGNLPKQVRFARGRAIMLVDENSIRMFSGALSTFLHRRLTPNAADDGKEKFQPRGRFIETGTLWQRALLYFCGPFPACRRWMVHLRTPLTLDNLASAGRIFDEIEADYRRQFDVEDFQILWTGNFTTLISLRAFTKAKISLAPSFPAGDPSVFSSDTTRRLADYLFAEKLIGGGQRAASHHAISAKNDSGEPGMEIQLNEALGKVPNWHRRFEYIRRKFFGGSGNGASSKKTRVTADENGFRLSSSARKAGKSKHFFLIGSSEIYGEGLSDDETVAEHINQRSEKYEAYPVAYLGWGAQHAWIRFSDGALPKQVPFSRGRAVMMLNEFTMGRFFGAPDSLLYLDEEPFVQEVSEGRFEVKGSFSLAGSWWQRAQVAYCNPFSFCGSLFPVNSWKPSLPQMKTVGRLLNDIDRMYRSQFDVEDFTILWYGSEEFMAAMRPLTKVKILAMPQPSKDQMGEPDADGARQMANFLFSQKLVE